MTFAVIIPTHVTVDDWMIHRRQYGRAHILLTEQAINRSGRDGAEEFSLGIRPLIAKSSIEEQRPGRHQRDHKMLVAGQLIPVTGILLNVAGKLPVEVIGHIVQRFAKIAPRQGGAQLAAAAREDCGDALILRPGP